MLFFFLFFSSFFFLSFFFLSLFFFSSFFFFLNVCLSLQKDDQQDQDDDDDEAQEREYDRLEKDFEQQSKVKKESKSPAPKLVSQPQATSASAYSLLPPVDPSRPIVPAFVSPLFSLAEVSSAQPALTPAIKSEPRAAEPTPMDTSSDPKPPLASQHDSN
jgi:hypothetical protein